MPHDLKSFWNRFVATFLSGLFAILPIVITVAIVGWAGQNIYAWIGPDSTIGGTLRSVGFQLVANETAATIVGFIAVILVLWVVGLLVKSRARSTLELVVKAL